MENILIDVKEEVPPLPDEQIEYIIDETIYVKITFEAPSLFPLCP
jgi:hypothetical protein